MDMLNVGIIPRCETLTFSAGPVSCAQQQSSICSGQFLWDTLEGEGAEVREHCLLQRILTVKLYLLCLFSLPGQVLPLPLPQTKCLNWERPNI